MTWIFSLSEIEDRLLDVKQVGGKAKNLGRLLQAGFAAPPGFCLTIAAYHHHLAANDLVDKIASILAGSHLSDHEKANQVRHMIVAADLPPDLRDAALKAYHHLTLGKSPCPVAVRSSAITEDTAQASFAGQHDSFLDVGDQETLLTNIKYCWASLWTVRSLTYRNFMRPDNPQAGLAVIVQQMVPADRAGVVFTTNPLTGAPEIVLEAVAGLGEHLVSGQVTPDRYRVDKQTWAIIEVQPTRGHQPILDTVELQQLAHLAVQVEDHFGQPQDIEWAQNNSHTYLLQTRPITTLTRPHFVDTSGQLDMTALLNYADEANSQIWTDDNVGEVIPGVVTPFSWSVLDPLGNGAFNGFLRRIGVRDYPGAGLFGRFYGRVYFNQSQFQRMMHRFYPSRMCQGHAGRFRLIGFIRVVPALFETGLRTLFLILMLPREVERYTRAIPRQLKDSPAPGVLTGQELWAEAEQWRQKGQKVLSVHLAVSILAILFYNLLDKLVSRWSNRTVETAHLVGGLPGIKSAAMGRDLAALVTQVKADAALQECLLTASPDTLADCINALPFDHHFRRRFEQFLDNHGHASLREFELAFPRWREDKTYVLTVLQGHLHAQAPGRQTASIEIQQIKCRNATRAMWRYLGIGPRRFIFEILLLWTQHFSVGRENAKYTFVMVHSHLRSLYLALAGHLVAQGTLADTAEIFYLTKEEVAAFLNQKINREELARTVAHRRIEQDHYQAEVTTLPKVVEQRPDGALQPLVLHSNGSPEKTDGTNRIILPGVAASPGRVTGRARVIFDPLDSTRLEHGEILVVPSTNPAWAPLLLNASALVTDIGGLLSHGAIIAREYGLPAVLNVSNATRRIRTGQLILVDGVKGVVQLFEEGEVE
ncbi:MAG: hypothetical protein JXM69_00895 [Anaerolineae bacterium]|nr:hypothetical protein [Anaerolineae bacterium]